MTRRLLIACIATLSACGGGGGPDAGNPGGTGAASTATAAAPAPSSPQWAAAGSAPAAGQDKSLVAADPVISTKGVPSAASEPLAAEALSMAFDQDAGTKYLGLFSAAREAWLAYEFGEQRAWRLTSYALVSGNDLPERDPRSWRVLGSNDGARWELVDAVVGDTGWRSRRQRRDFVPANQTSAYRAYRLVIDAVQSSSPARPFGVGLVQLSEWTLRGVPDGAASANLIGDPVFSTGGVAAAQNAPLPGERAPQAFDQNAGTKYMGVFSGSGLWLQYRPSDQRAWRLTSYALVSGNDLPGRDPKSWRVQGSNDGTSWDTLHAVTDDAGWSARGQHRVFVPGASGALYRHFRLVVDALQSSTAASPAGVGVFQIADWTLHGTPDASAPLPAPTLSPAPPLPAPAGRLIKVGPGEAISTVAGAAAVAQDGDTVEIRAGTYSGDVAVWRQNNLVIRGTGGRPVLDAAGRSAQGKAIFVINGENVLVENLEFVNAKVPDRNGAGIRMEGGSLVVRGSVFRNNEEGILTVHDDAATLHVHDSQFIGNGFWSSNGLAHGIYANRIAQLVIQGSYFTGTQAGHLIKSRARDTRILYNRITDEQGAASYEIDLPDGGAAYVVGNLIEKGSRPENPSLISYGLESVHWSVNELRVVNNTLVSRRAGACRWMQAADGTNVQSANNLLVGQGCSYALPASAQVANDTPVSDADFVDARGYDLRPRAGSAAARTRSIDAGASFGMSLAPVRQYAHPAGSAALAQPLGVTGALSVAP